MDTSNHIERHWEWIKYTLLQGKVVIHSEILLSQLLEARRTVSVLEGQACSITFNKFNS